MGVALCSSVSVLCTINKLKGFFLSKFELLSSTPCTVISNCLCNCSLGFIANILICVFDCVACARERERECLFC